MLSAQTPSDRATQLLALTRRLTDRLVGDTAVLEAHRPQDLIGGIEETRSLSNLYRMETARIKADPSLLSGISDKEKSALRDATELFDQALAHYERAVIAAKTITEGIVAAVADDLNSQAKKTATYGAHGRTSNNGPQTLNLGRLA
jgi:hypothetical protein